MKHITLMFISALILTGCVYPKKSHTYGNDDFEITFYNSGCDLTRHKAVFKNKSNDPIDSPNIRIMAVSEYGETIGEWVAYCGSTQPKGSSRCTVGRDYFQLQQVGCPNMRFTVN